VTTPEFSRVIDIRQAHGPAQQLVASADECVALAKRFDLVRVDRLEAELTLLREGEEVAVTGTLKAALVQSCAVSGDDLPVSVAEKLSFRFVPAALNHKPDEEIDLNADDLDKIDYHGTSFDLGEAVAQSLALAIDPFLVGPGAEEARRDAGLSGPGETGAFAGLKGLLG
jgi:uncharacterized metal-binding protein YceD (DUF177 family)